MSIDVFEIGNTIQFTFTSSIAPDSAPILKITDISGAVNSMTALQSNSTNFYSLYTIPNTEGIYLGEWIALKTLVSSERQFLKRFTFRASETKRTL